MKYVTKAVKKYGNSGGVYLPNDWIGGKVRIELIDEPANPRMDVLGKVPLEHVISAILYGSYVRDEMEKGSDIDLILVTDGEKKIQIPPDLNEKYDIQVKSLKSLRNALAHDPVFHKIIKDEGFAIMNRALLDDVVKEPVPVSRIIGRIDAIESSLNISKEISEIGENAALIDLVYPLMMRLKEIMILEYIFNARKYSTGLFKQEILKTKISKKELSSIMDVYRLARKGKKTSAYEISNDTIKKLVDLLETKVRYVRKKAVEKRN